jgi:hypothetical protein
MMLWKTKSFAKASLLVLSAVLLSADLLNAQMLWNRE